MWISLLIFGLTPLAGALIAIIFKYIFTQKNKLKLVESETATTISKNEDNNNLSNNILRKEEYETYQKLKYVNGVKIAAMSGSTLILIDLNLVKTVNQKDFPIFPDRHPPSSHPDPTMNRMLSFATGKEWKALKVILTQAFSTSRIRRVYKEFNENAIKLVEFMRSQLLENSSSPTDLEIVGPINKYLLELIACSVFGMKETGIFSSFMENSAFEIYTKEVQKAMVRHRKARKIPGLLAIAKFFNLLRPDPEAFHFFKTAIDQSIKTREEIEEGEKGNDLLQILLEAKESGSGLSEEMILSQAFMFFFAGTEGPATLLIYGLYELAFNPLVQERLYQEVSTAMGESSDSSVDYERLNELPYLDMFVCEVLRMYSSSVTARRCNTHYILPGTDISLKPGTTVHTPIYGIHHDGEYYPDPFKFNPENFTEEAKAKRPQLAFMPFGIGPRACIAQKFGLAQGKSALCHLVYNFKYSCGNRTEMPPKGSLESMYLPVNGLWLRVEDRANFLPSL